MVINRRKLSLPQPFDPILHCVACGSGFSMPDGRAIKEEREDWRRLIRRRKGRSAYITDKELEETDFKKHPEFWYYFYRTILEDPKTGDLRVSGISPAASLAWYPIPVPLNFHKARIWGAPKHDGRNNVDFHMANILGADWNRDGEELIGYPIHVPCWLLLDRIIGHDVIQNNLRSFIFAVEGFWRENSSLWETIFTHSDEENECYELGQHWLQDTPTIHKPPSDWHSECELPFPSKNDITKPWHEPGSPYRIPAIRELIERACQVKPDGSYRAFHNPWVSMIPIEIATMIIEIIYRSQKHSQARINDTRNILDAFQWELPGSYWRSRCNPDLVFEIDDLARSGAAVNWAYLCLGLEELLLDEDWYCNSGLNNRGRTMSLMRKIKMCFLTLLDAGAGVREE